MQRLVVGISGGSGIILAKKLLEAVPLQIDLVITPQALYTAKFELGPEFATARRLIASLSEETQKRITLHGIQDIGSNISSGSHLTCGMVIIPCSMATVAAVAMGLGDNCLRRAADVTLKERRPLVIVPRESPFSQIHLENMLKLTQCGATILPPAPAWYTNPKTLDDVEDFIVGKVMDALRLDHSLYPRWWKAPSEDRPELDAHKSLHASSQRQ